MVMFFWLCSTQNLGFWELNSALVWYSDVNRQNHLHTGNLQPDHPVPNEWEFSASRTETGRVAVWKIELTHSSSGFCCSWKEQMEVKGDVCCWTRPWPLKMQKNRTWFRWLVLMLCSKHFALPFQNGCNRNKYPEKASAPRTEVMQWHTPCQRSAVPGPAPSPHSGPSPPQPPSTRALRQGFVLRHCQAGTQNCRCHWLRACKRRNVQF